MVDHMAPVVLLQVLLLMGLVVAPQLLVVVREVREDTPAQVGRAV
jgi:hypothetical protein